MVRSIWMKTFMGILASAGLVLGQQAVPTPPASDAVGRVITVTEMGKPSQKCKIIKEWRMEDGSLVRQVEALDSGERMTIVETGVLSTAPNPSGGQIKSVASRIFHWGRSQTAPAGTPLPPVETKAPPTVTVDKSKERLEAKPETTIAKVDPAPSSYAPTRAEPKDKPQSPVATDSTTSTDYAPAKPTSRQVVQNKEASNAYMPTRPVWTRSGDAPAKSTVAVETAETPPAPPAQPANWRQSWGSLDDSGKPTRKDKASRKLADKPVVSHTDDPKPDKPRTDPLIDPLPYTKPGADERINEKMKTPAHKLESLSGDAVKPVKAESDPLPPLPPLPPLDAKPDLPPPMPIKVVTPSQSAKTELPPLPMKVETPSQPAKSELPPLPVGSESVIAAGGDPTQLPTPIAKMPKEPRSAKQYATDNAQINAFTPPPNAPARPESMRGAGNPYESGHGMPAPTPVGPGMVQANYETTTGIDAKTQDYLHLFKESIYPSQREWVAEQMAACDWRKNDAVVEAILTGAKDDPAATVRAACVRCLAKMKVNTVPVVVALQGLKADVDPRVRTEVDEALSSLAPGLPMQPSGPAIPEVEKGN
jgi:hypothetical protein